MDEPRRIQRAERLAVLDDTGLLDRPPAPGLDRLTRLAARLLDVPTALVSLVAEDRQVFASQVGLPEPWSARGQTPLSHSFCQYVVDDGAPLVVSDARRSERLDGNRAVDEIGVIAYAGMPIRLGDELLGSFCAIDSEPRDWTARDLAVLEDLAAAVASEIALIRAVRDTERRNATMRAILEVSHDAYVSIDAAGTVLEWNPAAEQLFGWSRAEAVGSDMSGMIIPAEYRATHRANLARVRAADNFTLAGQRLELLARHRSGRCFPVEFSLQITEVDGRLVFHAFVHDITGRRAIEAQLRRQAELIDAAPAAIVVRDPGGTVRSWNRGAEQMYIWPAVAVVGRNMHTLLGTRFPGSSLADVERSLAETGSWQGELVHRRADGSTVVVLSRHALRPSADGTGQEVIETNTDITDRRLAEEALAVSEHQFRMQFSQSTIGQALLGLDGRLQHVNDAYAAMLGYTPAQLDGMDMTELTHPADRADDAGLRAGLFAGSEDSYERVKRLTHADGHPVDVRIGVRLVRDGEGHPLHFIGVVQDITEQLRAERERDCAYGELTERTALLARANLVKLDLMGMLSHDIGTPLALILGYGKSLIERGLPEAAAGPITKMMRAAHRIDRLRHDVLAMCSVDGEELTTRRQEVPLAVALREALDATDTDVPVDCPADARVLANPAHLRQIMVNFLTNATKYGGGATGVTVRRTGGRISVAVHDEGDGVPAELQPHLFDRFTRAGGAATVGHGLGLHIVSSLAGANGGAVTHRENQPCGSVFILTLDEALTRPAPVPAG